MTLDCKSHQISQVENFGLTFNRENNLKNHFFCSHFTTDNNLLIDDECQLKKEANEILKKECQKKTKCEIDLNYYQIFQKCDFISKQNLQNLEDVYFSYSCFSKYFSLKIINIF